MSDRDLCRPTPAGVTVRHPYADAADTLLRVVSLAPFLCVLCVWVHGCMEARAGVSLLGSLIFALLPGGTVSH